MYLLPKKSACESRAIWAVGSLTAILLSSCRVVYTTIQIRRLNPKCAHHVPVVLARSQRELRKGKAQRLNQPAAGSALGMLRHALENIGLELRFLMTVSFYSWVPVTVAASPISY